MKNILYLVCSVFLFISVVSSAPDYRDRDYVQTSRYENRRYEDNNYDRHRSNRYGDERRPIEGVAVKTDVYREKVIYDDRPLSRDFERYDAGRPLDNRNYNSRDYNNRDDFRSRDETRDFYPHRNEIVNDMDRVRIDDRYRNNGFGSNINNRYENAGRRDSNPSFYEHGVEYKMQDGKKLRVTRLPIQ
uniref:FMRFamide neuropeptide n=1 Tax=Rhabditophanes sp. KR3021 TaxID=114890 RepID=A0AC35TRY1_9BILA